MGIVSAVMKLKNSREMLSSILKTTQMGQIGIRSVMKTQVSTDLREALESQLKEYDSIETEAHRIASQRSWELPELNPAVRIMSDMTVRSMMRYGGSDSKAAGMMIQGNTRGMIKSLQNLHHYHQQDLQITALSQKLLDCENANILQMEDYL